MGSRASKEMTHPVVTCKLRVHTKNCSQMCSQGISGLLVRFFTEYFICYTSGSLESSARGFVEKKVIILVAVVLKPVCGRGISRGHDIRAQTSAGGKKTE